MSKRAGTGKRRDGQPASPSPPPTGNGDAIEVVSPVTGETIRTVPLTPTSELQDLVKSSKTAQEKWARATLSERATALRGFIRVLEEEAETVAEEIHLLNGKLPEEALTLEILPTLSNFDYFARQASKTLRPRKVRPRLMPFAKARIYYEPIGVIGVISPWNFPMLLALMDVPAALMAGNSVLIKTSEFSAGIGHLIEELMARADMPQGLVRCIYGYGDLGAALVSSGINKICFTGSTATGRKVYEAAANAMIPCTLELGGKDAAIVLEDADLNKTVEGIFWAGTTNSGQACASIERVYIPKARMDEFHAAFCSFLQKIPDEQFGYMNTRNQKRLVEEQLEEIVSSGADVTRKNASDGEESTCGFRLKPAIVRDFSKSSTLFREETFGPVLPLVAYSDLDEVIDEVNAGSYGLTTSVWTKSGFVGERIARRVATGTVTINDHLLTAGMPELPWGGWRESGIGFSHSEMALIHFSKVKSFYDDRGLMPLKFWHYPLSPRKKTMLLAFMRAQFAASLRTRLRSWARVLISFFR